MTANEWRHRSQSPWRIAIVSDPHGDLIALQNVIADLDALGAPVDEVLVGGDLAQGGAQPAEVVDLIRARGWSAVRGNADDLLVRLADGATPEEALRPGAATHPAVPDSLVSDAVWPTRSAPTPDPRHAVGNQAIQSALQMKPFIGAPDDATNATRIVLPRALSQLHRRRSASWDPPASVYSERP